MKLLDWRPGRPDRSWNGEADKAGPELENERPADNRHRNFSWMSHLKRSARSTDPWKMNARRTGRTEARVVLTCRLSRNFLFLFTGNKED